jgi:hypothetical protein
MANKLFTDEKTVDLWTISLQKLYWLDTFTNAVIRKTEDFYSNHTWRNSVLVNRCESRGTKISSSLRKIITTGTDYTNFNEVHCH